LARTTHPRESTRKKKAGAAKESPSVGAHTDSASAVVDSESAGPGAGEDAGDADGAREGVAEPAEDAEEIGADADLTDDGPVPVIEVPETKEASIARFDSLAAYLREVQRHPLLLPEETQALAVKFATTQDAAAAARLVTANLRLVVKIAYEYRRAYKNILDLI
jgi:RNA polymerase sigma-32 factor